MKVKLFTHTDLDGIGCAILGKLAFEDIDIEYCNYDDVNIKIEEFYIGSQKNNYDLVFITDISINEEVAKIIDYYKDEKLYPKTKLLDHHPTAEELNKYEWVRVSEYIEDNVKNSGTMMFYHELMGIVGEKLHLSNSDNCFDFAEMVRKYDTWEWKTKYNDNIPKQWNDLFGIVGRDDFINKILYKVQYDPCFIFSCGELDLIKYKQKEIDKYIENKNKQIIKKDILGYKAGIVFAEQYHSETGNRLSELNEDLDFIVLINPSYLISYRTIKDVDLGKDIAKVFDGGRHPKAAGSPLTEEVRNQIIDLIFTK